MTPLLSPCDVGRWVTVHFGYPPVTVRPPVSGVLRVVRWLRDRDGELRIVIEIDVLRVGVLAYDIDESEICRVTIDGQTRSSGRTR